MVKENRVLIWLRIGTRLLDQRLKHDIHVWGHKRHCCTSEAMKDTAIFGFVYWLLCLDGHAFVLAFSKLLVWPLVERSPRVERLLSAFPDTLYRRCWSISGGIWLLMKAPKCFLLLGSHITKRGSRGLAFGHLPTSRILRCQWLLRPHPPCYLRLRILAPFLALAELCYSLAPS